MSHRHSHVGTFAPPAAAPAAPLARQVLAQARIESVLLLRNGEQLLLALVIPVLVLVGGVTGIEHLDLSLSHSPVDELAPGVLGLAIMSTSFTSLAIATGFERRYGVLKRLGASPLPRSGLLLGKIGALLLVEALQILVVGGVALLLGWSPEITLRGLAGAAGDGAARHRGLRVAGPLRRRCAAAGGHAGGREPRLPPARGRGRRSCCPRTPTAPSATSWCGCPPGRWAAACASASSTGRSR